MSTANTLIGLSQLSGIVMIFFAGWITDRVGQKRIIALSMLLTGILTVLISCTRGWMLILVLFLQPAVLTAFFPAGFAALSTNCTTFPEECYKCNWAPIGLSYRRRIDASVFGLFRGIIYIFNRYTVAGCLLFWSDPCFFCKTRKI